MLKSIKLWGSFVGVMLFISGSAVAAKSEVFTVDYINKTPSAKSVFLDTQNTTKEFDNYFPGVLGPKNETANSRAVEHSLIEKSGVVAYWTGVGQPVQDYYGCIFTVSTISTNHAVKVRLQATYPLRATTIAHLKCGVDHSNHIYITRDS